MVFFYNNLVGIMYAKNQNGKSLYIYMCVHVCVFEIPV